MFFLKELPGNTDEWLDDFKKIADGSVVSLRKCYVVTAQRDVVTGFLAKNKITVTGVLTCDATAIKTAARANPTLYRMKGPVVQQKLSWADLDELK